MRPFAVWWRHMLRVAEFSPVFRLFVEEARNLYGYQGDV